MDLSRRKPFALVERMIGNLLPRSASYVSSTSSQPFFPFSPCGGSWRSYGLNSALAGKGVIVQGNAFLNLNPSELLQRGATVPELLSGLPIHVRGHGLRGSSEISKPQFTKLLKQVTSHISSISNIYVHDGAIGSTSKCNVKIRIISDSPSPVLAFSNIIWETPTRAISHDSCPLTVYAAESISPGVGNTIDLGARGNNGFIAADIERSMQILCGKAFSDTNGTKKALVALSEPVIFARGGLPLPARLLVSGDFTILLFAPEDVIQTCATFLVSRDASVVLSSEGVMPFFCIGNADGPNLFKLPSAFVIVTSDSSRTIPSASKLSPGQAAYHFLAGYQNGKFVPAFNQGPSCIDPLELAKALLCTLKEHQIPSFLVNAKGTEGANGKDLITLVESTMSMNIPPFQARGGELKRQYESFLRSKHQQLPEDLRF